MAACFFMWARTPSRSLRNLTWASWPIFSGLTRIVEKASRIWAMSSGSAVMKAMPELGKVTLAVEPNS